MSTRDWERNVAFIRLDFPSSQRDAAQVIATMFAHFVGRAIMRLQPEHTLGEILSWSESPSLASVGFVMALEEHFGGEIGDEFALHFEARTFRELVQHVSPTTTPA